MIYVLENATEEFAVKAPDDINHDMAIEVLIANENWKLKEIAEDDKYLDCQYQDITDIMPPNLFINTNDETGRLVPDMDYMSLVDKEFMEDMLYHWSKTGRKDYMRILDDMEENIDELIDSCFVIDVLT